MTDAPREKYSKAHLYCLLAGAADSLTGLLLVAIPQVTLGLMGIWKVPTEPVYLRFVGAFVGGVGLSYLYPFLYRDRRRTDSTLAAVLEVTALIRLGIAIFVAWAIVSGALSMGWVSVLATDLVLAVAQIVMVKRRVFDREPEAGGGER